MEAAFRPRGSLRQPHLGPFDFVQGKLIIVWGRADGINSTNVLTTPIDLRIRSPWEDDRRLGNIGLRTFVNIKQVRLEGVWLPVYRPNEIPTPAGRICLPDRAEDALHRPESLDAGRLRAP